MTSSSFTGRHGRNPYGASRLQEVMKDGMVPESEETCINSVYMDFEQEQELLPIQVALNIQTMKLDKLDKALAQLRHLLEPLLAADNTVLSEGLVEKDSGHPAVVLQCDDNTSRIERAENRIAQLIDRIK